MSGGEHKWTTDEDTLLCERYPSIGPHGCAALFPARTPKGIQARAAFLGVRTYHMWTKAEDEVLRMHYPIGGLAACLDFLPVRTPGAIHQRAFVLNVKQAGIVEPAPTKTPAANDQLQIDALCRTKRELFDRLVEAQNRYDAVSRQLNKLRAATQRPDWRPRRVA